MIRSILFLSTCILISCADSASGTETTSTNDVSSKYENGLEVYLNNCVACHQAEGEGVKGAFPPLAKSDYLLADKIRAIKQIINGSSGEMIVNGETYNSIMPPQPLTDEEIKEVMNYILNSWGNAGGEVTLEEVRSQH